MSRALMNQLYREVTFCCRNTSGIHYTSVITFLTYHSFSYVSHTLRSKSGVSDGGDILVGMILGPGEGSDVTPSQ